MLKDVPIIHLESTTFFTSNSKQLSIDNSKDALGINNEIKITHSNK
jgi:hypothetical protein